MNTKRLVRLIQASLTPDLLNREQRKLLTGTHPTQGHCYVAAEAAFHLLGGSGAGWVPMVLPKAVLGHTTHWWLEKKGKRLDPTAEQFPEPVPYDRGMPCGFLTKQPSKRAAVVIQRVKERSP